MKYKVLAIIGPSACGKDTIQRWIVNNHANEAKGIVSCTTRPPRDCEQNGIDYYFLNNEEFAEKVLNGEMLEATDFRGWFYGTPITPLVENKINVGVFNPAGVECLLSDSRLEVVVARVYASQKTCLLRSLHREKNPDCMEVCRRFLADQKDFEEIDFDYFTWLNNEEKDCTDEARNWFWERAKQQFTE